jgi:hypothetical protein
MTIATETVKVQYQGNGTTTIFSIPYPLVTPGDLEVTLYDSVHFATIAPTPVMNGGNTYDFTFSGQRDPAGTNEYIADNQITFNTAPPANYRITIIRNEPYLQDLSLGNFAFAPKMFEGPGFDNTVFQTEQLAEQVGQCLQAPASDTGPPAPLPPQELRAGMILGFDGNGNPIAINAGFGTIIPAPPIYCAGIGGGTIITAAAGLTYLCDCTHGPVTINLPSSCAGLITIKDATGQASATNPIVVQPPAGVTIEGKTVMGLTYPYSWVQLMGYGPTPQWVQV